MRALTGCLDLFLMLRETSNRSPGWTTTSLGDKTTDKSGALGRESPMRILTCRWSVAEINPGANNNRMAARMYVDGFIIVFRRAIDKSRCGKISRVDG